MAEAEEIDLTDDTVTDTLLQMDGAGINLQDIDRSMLAQLTDDQFVTLLVKVYTSRGTQYMNQHINKIAWRIKQLPGDKVSAYIFQIMQSYHINIEGLRTLIRRTPIHTLCSDRDVVPSLALFIGFGHDGSNEGIVKKVNEAFPQIMNYKKPTLKSTPPPQSIAMKKTKVLSSHVPKKQSTPKPAAPSQFMSIKKKEVSTERAKSSKSSLPPQLLEQIGKIFLNTYKEWGAERMNREIAKIAPIFLQLPNKVVVNYIIGVLDHIGKDIKTVAYDIKHKKDSVHASYSIFFGLGNSKTNPGINEKINTPAIGGKKVQNFVPSVATFGFEAFLESNESNAVYILLNTFKHPDWGAREMNRQMTPEIAAKILQLLNKDVVRYLIGGMDHIGKDIKTVREEIKEDTIRATGLVPRGRGGASYSTYFGLGDESTNPGIAGKLGTAIGGKEIKRFVYIALETTFGFEAIITLASSARQAVAEQAPPVELTKNKKTKKKKAQTKSSKSPSSPLLPSVMPSSKRMRSNTNNVALHRSSSDMESAVGSEMGKQKMPHRPPQQADAQVMHGSGGGKSDRALAAKPSNDLYRSASSGEENNSNNINSSGEKMPSAFQSGQIGMPFGMATHQYPQQLHIPRPDHQQASIPNTGNTDGTQNQQMMPSQMMMMNPQMIQMFGQCMVNNPEKMMQMMEQMSQGSITQQGIGGMNDTTNQSSSISPPAVGGEIGNQKMPQADTQGDRSDSAQGSATPASKPSNESTTQEEAEDGESPQSKDSLEAEKTTAQDYGHDDEIDSSDEIKPNFNQIQDDETRIAHEKMKAFRSKTFEHDKQLPSNLCKKSVQNDPKKFKPYLLKLPNKENVKVIKLLGEGAYAATYHVKYKGKDCALKVQLTSDDDKADSLAMEFDYQLDLMYRVDQELGIIPIPLELHAFTNGSLFFMSLENGKTLHHIATGPTLSLGVLVYLADLMLSTVVTLHSKGHSVSGSDDMSHQQFQYSNMNCVF